jgi:hypothetical protein
MNTEDLDYHREKNADFMAYIEEARGFLVVADPQLEEMIKKEFSSL